MEKHDVSDPTPTCGVITSPPLRGENVTLSCSMSYLTHTGANVAPGTSVSRSISWDSAAGTFLNSSSTPVYNKNGQISKISIGETLQVEVIKLASGAEIPSYKCITTFRFTDRPNHYYSLALNNVTWSYVSAPVITWCTYFRSYLSYS